MASLSRFTLIILLAIGLTIAQSKKLVFIQEIFRHGARYPIQNSQNDKPDSSAEQKLKGELTYQGKHMHYVLGRAMFDKYWKSLFAGTEYLKKYHPSQLYVRSTNFNRTIESAQSHLLGLLQTLDPYQLPNSQLNNSLPPFLNAKEYHLSEDNQTTFNIYGPINTDFHAIPIHTDRENSIPAGSNYKYQANPYDQGDFLSKYDEMNCPNAHFWSRQNRLSEDAMKIKQSDKIKTFLSSLSNAVGHQVKFQDAYTYVDSYICQQFLGKQYPDIFNNPNIQKTGDFVLLASAILTFFYTQDQIKSSNTRLIQSTIHNMKQAMVGHGPRFVIYSAHDTTILSFNTALQLVSLKCAMSFFLDGINNADSCINLYPSFATNIVIQLWEEDNLSHSVKILYNGVPRKMPTCGNKQSCPFSEFEKWANDFYIPDPNDTCGIREQYTKLYIVIGVLSVFIVAFIIVSMRSRFKKKMEEKMVEMEEKKGYIENFEEKETH